MKWGANKWGSSKWGYVVAPDSDTALERAIISGDAPWLPRWVEGYPTGGNPYTGAPLERHAVVRAYILNSNWTTNVELVGIVGGSRTSTLNGFIQQDSLTLELWDPTDYFTTGAGKQLIANGTLIKVEITIASSAGSFTYGLGVYRIWGTPNVNLSRQGTRITLTCVDWIRPYLSMKVGLPTTCPDPNDRAWVTDLSAEAKGPTGPWPTVAWELNYMLSRVTCQPGYTNWASEQFDNLRTQDFDDGNGPQPIWATTTNSYTVAAFVWMLGRNSIDHFWYSKLFVDVNFKNPFSEFFGGQYQETQALGSDFLIKPPEWRDILSAQYGQAPFWAVFDGSGNIHFRHPAGRYPSSFVVSCDPNIGGLIQLPVETINRVINQPEYTAVLTYRQINPQVDGSGAVVRQGSFFLRSVSVVPPRFVDAGNLSAHNEVIVYDTFDPPPVGDGVTQVLEIDQTLPWMDDGTSRARMLDILRQADQVTVTTDSAFPYIKLGNEVRIVEGGVTGYFTVTSITQPFDTGPMSITMGWRAD